MEKIKKKKKKTAVSSNPKVQSNHQSNFNKKFQSMVLARFTTSLAKFVDLGLTREQLICLYKECLEVACYNNDIHLKMQLIELSFSKKIPFDSHLKEFHAYLLQNQKIVENRILYFKKCIEVAKATRDRNAEMNAYLSLGIVSQELGQYYDVIIYSNKCLAIAEEIGDKRIAMMSYLKLGTTYREIKLDNDAIANTKKCIDIAKEIDRKDIEMTACFIVGKLYFNQGNYKESVLYGERSLQNAKVVGDKRYESMVYLLIQDCQYRMSEYKEALISGQKCIAASKDIGDKTGETVAYAILGKTYESLNQMEDAVLYSRKSTEVANETGDNISAMNEYFSLGQTYHSLEQFDSAIEYTMKCLDIAKETGNRNVQMMAYLLLADIYKSLDKLDESITYLKKIFDTSEMPTDKTLEFQAHFLFGKIYFSKGQFDTAVAHFKKSLDLVIDTRSESDIKYLYMALGDSYLQLQQHNNARDCLQKCLNIAKETGDKKAEGDAYICLGKNFDRMLQRSDAILQLKKGVEIFQDIGIKESEKDANFLLGKVYRTCKRYDEAIECLKKSLVIAWKIGDKDAQKDAYLEIGNIYEFMNHFDKAVWYGNKCMEVAKEIGDENDVTNVYLALGIAYLGLDKYDEAFSNLSAGLKLATERKNTSIVEEFNSFLNEIQVRIKILGRATDFEAFISCGHPCLEVLKEEGSDEQGAAAVKKGETFFDLYKKHRLNKDYKKAILCLKQHLAMFELCSHFHGTDKVYCLLQIATLHTNLGQYEESLQCYKESLAVAIQVDAKHLEAISYSSQGDTYLKLRRMKEAENSFRESIRSFEIMFAALQLDSFKISLLDTYVHSYKNLTYVLVQEKQFGQALIASDQGRARCLNGFLQKYGIDRGVEIESELEFKDIESLVVSGSKYSMLFYSVMDAVVYVFIIESGKELQFSIKVLGCTCGRGVTFDMITNKALEEIEVWGGADNCENRSLDKLQCEVMNEANVVSPDAIGSLSARPQNGRLSEGYRSPMDEKASNKSKEIKGSALERLHQMLLKYHEIYSVKQDETITFAKNVKYIGKEDEIVVVPEGSLYKVPFAALRDPDTGRYLSETKRIRLAPSLATLKMLQESTEDHYSKKGAVIIGDPLVGKVIFNGVEKEFPPLENAFCEALAVGSIFCETPLTKEEATKPAVIERLKEGVAVVHIAAHGSLTNGTIALAPSPEIRATKIPDEEDYMLTMADVQQAQVRAQLVVLSCCHSGRGEIRAEGVVGMCRAFLASGARAVVASLWAIDDEATLEFMIRFYQNLRDGKSASTSLQQAMNEMRTSTEYKKPKYWAPFFLIGDDVTIQF